MYAAQNFHGAVTSLQHSLHMMPGNDYGRPVMDRIIDSSLDVGKQRARAEISNHVEEFLRRGGRIEIVDSPALYKRADLLKGGAGHDLDFTPALED